MIDFTAMGWPQYVILCLYAFNIILTSVLHGQPKTGTHSVVVMLVATSISFGLLYAGGFWEAQS